MALRGKYRRPSSRLPGKGWFALLRLYGPLESLFSKEWRLSEIELVKQATPEQDRFRSGCCSGGFFLSVKLSLRLALAMIAALVLGSAAPALGQGSCDVSQLRTDERPDPKGVPTHVQLGVLVADVLGVDDVAQAATLDLLAVARWRDPRLVGLEGCRVLKTAVWFPRVEILNSNELVRERTSLADRVEILENGNVRYVQRLTGPISTYHQLQRFPFDRHQFKFSVVALDYPADQLVIDVDTAFTHLGDRQNIADWQVYSASGASEVGRVDEFSQDYSIFTLTIDLARSWTFYIWRLLLPMVLIVVMSFAVFWISPERFGPQISLSVTAMLTLIAFQFLVASSLPKLSYFTVLDKLIVSATVLVFVTMLECMVTANLVSAGKADLAHKIDRRSRVIFPVAFVLCWVVILW